MLYIRRYLITAMFFAAFQQAAFGNQACPVSPCDSVQKCQEIADWTIEGTVLDNVGGKPQEACIDGPDGKPYCGQVGLPQPDIILENTLVIKGAFEVSDKSRGITRRAAVCYSLLKFPLVHEKLSVGKRYRFFGRKSHYGFYYVEEIQK